MPARSLPRLRSLTPLLPSSPRPLSPLSLSSSPPATSSSSPSSSPPRAPRHFSTSPTLPSSSPLFNLTGLSNARETSHFSRERRIPRTEFSPQLQLLRSSEVDPFAPVPGASGAAVAAAAASARAAAAEQLRHEPESDVPASGDGRVVGQSSDPVGPGFALERVLGEMAVMRRQLEGVGAELEGLARRQKKVERKAAELGSVVSLSVVALVLVGVVLLMDDMEKLVGWWNVGAADTAVKSRASGKASGGTDSTGSEIHGVTTVPAVVEVAVQGLQSTAMEVDTNKEEERQAQSGYRHAPRPSILHRLFWASPV